VQVPVKGCGVNPDLSTINQKQPGGSFRAKFLNCNLVQVQVKDCGVNPDLRTINQQGCFTLFQQQFVKNIGIVGGIIFYSILYTRG
jgi:hypothetical protein